ncbi:MAG: hypothetical protein R3B07_35765 [Polyangiaceae bacterium]
MAITITYDDFLVYGFPERTLQGHPNNAVTAAQIARYLTAAASRIAACLEASARRVVDEANPPDEIRQQGCHLAAWPVLTHLIGYNPENPADEAIHTSYEDAMKWLERVCAGHPVDGTEGVGGGAPSALIAIATEPSRNWS